LYRYKPKLILQITEDAVLSKAVYSFRNWVRQGHQYISIGFDGCVLDGQQKAEQLIMFVTQYTQSYTLINLATFSCCSMKKLPGLLLDIAAVVNSKARFYASLA